MITKNKIAGSLIGSAIGDGFGYPTEFMKPSEMKAKWGEKGLTAPIGDIIQVTDDTQMALAVGRALMASWQNDHLDQKRFEANLVREFILWLNDPENNRAPGMTCLTACERLETGLHWTQATGHNSKGCGANMRVLPIALMKGKSDQITHEDIGRWSQFQSAVTHGHPTALTASELTAMTTVFLLEGVSTKDLLAALQDHCQSQMDVYHEDWLKNVWERPGIYSPEVFINRGWEDCLAILDRVETALVFTDKIQDPCDLTGEGWIAEEAFGTALLCFLLSPDDPVKTLIQAVNTKGDSDSIACLAGSFSGAKNGLDAFPEDWVERIEYQSNLDELISFLGGTSLHA
ncbi:MAG: ADP-ribosylglycohydrolase family protein [Bacteroidota bacterium]